MLLERIKDEELLFLEDLHNPQCASELLFSNLKPNDLVRLDDTLADVRLYQYSMMSFEYLLDEDSALSKKENFKLRENCGSIYAFGARKYGKTIIVEVIDMLISMVLLQRENVGFASYDAIHIRGVLETVIQVVEKHPFFAKILRPKVNRSPNYRIFLESGYTLDSINLNLGSKNPGAQFFQKHLDRLYGEEYSFETEEVHKKRLDAVSEYGCINRLAGMTNFTRHSPSGRIFDDPYKKPWISNYPQYVNPLWDEKEREKAIREHGGENTASYRIFVEGEIVTEGINVFDLERVQQCYLEDREIKHFEILKENFDMFENILVVDRPSNSDMVYLAADIGESAPTEIIILAQINKKYRYIYSISLYNLTDKQQYKIFKYLAEKIGINVLALDTTEGTGRAIYRGLEEIFPKENLVWVGFNEKMDIDFERDEFNKVVFKDGSPVYKEEFVTDFSITRLKTLLYDKLLELPIDYRFEIQINNVVSMLSGKRVIYQCLAEEDHLFSAFRVFCVAQWQYEFKIVKSMRKKKFSKVGV
jgi:hypothetical protein